MKLMIEKLKEKRKGIPAPSRDEMVEMVYNAMKNTNVDNIAAFKSLFLTNALDGSEDWKVSDKINSLIGTELKEFRRKLMQEKCPKDLEELLKQINVLSEQLAETANDGNKDQVSILIEKQQHLISRLREADKKSLHITKNQIEMQQEKNRHE